MKSDKSTMYLAREIAAFISRDRCHQADEYISVVDRDFFLSKFGELEDVGIKCKQNGDASYAFMLFTSIDSAYECQLNLNDKHFRRGSDEKFKIGFGKVITGIEDIKSEISLVISFLDLERW
jgi:hypothetical protein